jgi:DNA topoisomerase II
MTTPRETTKEYATEDWKTFVLREPDTFLGSGVLQFDYERVFDTQTQSIVDKSVFASQALKHTFTEALSNAQDSILRAKDANLPAVSIGVRFLNQRHVEITNIGADIISVRKNDEGTWIPESVLGNLLSGSNSKAKNKVWVGKNGVGGSLVNIFSKDFYVEVWDHVRKVYYRQEWHNNCVKKTPQPLLVEEGKEMFKGHEQIPSDCGAVRVGFDIDFAKFVTKDVEETHPEEPIVKGFYNHPLMELYTRKILDCSLATQVPVSLYWTDQEGAVVVDRVFQIKDIQEYSELFFPKEKPANFLVYKPAFPKTWKPAKTEGVMAEVQAIIYDTPDEGFAFSFVNGQPTELGGVHVEETCRAICQFVIDAIEEETKDKNVKLTQGDIMNHLTVFVNVTVPDPKFTGQTKGRLTSPKPAIRWYEDAIAKVKGWSMIQAVQETLESKRKRLVSKTDGKKVRRVNIAKAEDANMAGSTESTKCVLWLCEGDSAKNYALTLLENLPGGRNYNGIYPLSGKILNTMKASAEQLTKNKQVLELKIMLGLQEAVDYSLPENRRQLRYGKVGVLTDMDMDGIHIKYLLTVFFGSRFSGILESGNLITWMSPIIRAKRARTSLRFFTMADFHNWKNSKAPSEMKKWTIKYYKGLGGSTDAEVEEDVKNPHVEITVFDGQAKDSLELGFHTKRIADRKRWINGVIRVEDGAVERTFEDVTKTYDVTEDRVSGLTYEPVRETLGMFLNNVDHTTKQETTTTSKKKKSPTTKTEEVTTEEKEQPFSGLMIERKSVTRGIHQDYMSFNLLTLKRAIPSEIDGLKVSERKIVWTALKSLKNGEEIKTAQFGNIVAKETDYAHNEQILEKVVSGMTQDFPTANNMPHFRGNGQFGSQYLPKASSGRYTHIEKNFWLRAVYREEDDAILPMVFDEGRETEPEHLVPILPMTLVNGACGIANGFSTFIPQYNPIDILNCLEDRLRGLKSEPQMTPWYRNHNGTIELLVEDTPEQRVLGMQSYGCYEEQKGGKILVTELPVGLHGEAYRKKLNEWRENFTKVRKQTIPGENKANEDTRAIKDFNNQCKKNTMRFEILGVENASYQSLGLVKRLGMTNMTLLESVNPIPDVKDRSRGVSMEPYIPRTFGSIEEYIDQFIKVRHYYYNLRKNHLIKTKQGELTTLRAKHRFIRDVVTKVVDVFTWKEDQILEKMTELGHAEILYSQTPIRRFSPEEVTRLEAQIEVEVASLNQLIQTDPVTMWLNDLKEFRDLYLRHYKGEDGVRKTAARKVKLVKVKKGTQFTSDDILELAKLKGEVETDSLSGGDGSNDEELE